MIAETTKAFTENLKERITNPFFGAFIICWLYNNWQIPFIIFFDSKKWDLAEKIVQIGNYANKNDLLLKPLWEAVILSILYPVISYLVYCLMAFFEMLKKKAKMSIENTQCLTILESQALRLDMMDNETRFGALIQVNNEKTDRALEDKVKSDQALTKLRDENIKMTEEHNKKYQDLQKTVTGYQKVNEELKKKNSELQSVDPDVIKWNEKYNADSKKLANDMFIKDERIKYYQKKLKDIREEIIKYHLKQFDYTKIMNKYSHLDYNEFLEIYNGEYGVVFHELLTDTTRVNEFHGVMNTMEMMFFTRKGILREDTKIFALTEKGLNFKEMYFDLTL